MKDLLPKTKSNTGLKASSMGNSTKWLQLLDDFPAVTPTSKTSQETAKTFSFQGTKLYNWVVDDDVFWYKEPGLQHPLVHPLRNHQLLSTDYAIY
jgi:hypothetical protein